jgi:hypothetical protein
MTINTAADTAAPQPKNVSNSELERFRAWEASNIREAALAEGRNQAGAAQIAEEQQADADALQRLTSKGLTLRECFGRLSTDRGRGVLINLHRSSFGSKSTAYIRLRRMAREQNLVQ